MKMQKVVFENNEIDSVLKTNPESINMAVSKLIKKWKLPTTVTETANQQEEQQRSVQNPIQIAMFMHTDVISDSDGKS